MLFIIINLTEHILFCLNLTNVELVIKILTVNVSTTNIDNPPDGSL